MSIKRHGVFANAEEVAYIKNCQQSPLMAFTNPAPPGHGIPHAISIGESPIEAAHHAAIKHGLPEIAGYYGIDLKNGEFVSAMEES